MDQLTDKIDNNISTNHQLTTINLSTNQDISHLNYKSDSNELHHHNYHHHNHYHHNHQITCPLNNNKSNINFTSAIASVSAILPLSSELIIKNYKLLTCWCWLKQFRAIGTICAFASVLSWSFNGLSYKLNHDIHALEILAISSTIVSISYLCFMYAFYGVRNQSKSSTWNSRLESFNWKHLFGVPGERISLALRCLCGTISLACFYSSYRYIPLGDATTIRFTSPVFIAIFAHFLLKEAFGPLQIINCFTTLIGVVLIGRPSFLFGNEKSILNGPKSLKTSFMTFNNSIPLWRNKQINEKNPAEINIISILTTNSIDNDDFTTSSNIVKTLLKDRQAGINVPTIEWSSTMLGVFLALIAAISISISMIFMRKLKKTPPPLVIFWFCLSNVILGAVGLFIIGEYRMPRTINCWLLITMTTFCTGLDQLFITLALQLEKAGVVAIIQALCVVLGFVFSVTILQEPLYWTSVIGGIFIIITIITLGTSKLINEINYRNIKSTIFAINILHSNSKKFNLTDSYSKLSTKLSSNGKLTRSLNPMESSSSALSSTTTLASNSSPLIKSMHKNKQCKTMHYGEPFLLRVAPILGDHHEQSHQSNVNISVQISVPNTDLNNNGNK